MLSMQDWFNQFQAINGRVPTQQELAQAQARGEFIPDTIPQGNQTSSWMAQQGVVAPNPSQPQIAQPQAQAVQPQFQGQNQSQPLADEETSQEKQEESVTYPLGFKKLTMGLVALFLSLFLLIGLGALIRYQTSDIRGVWQLEKVEGRGFSEEFSSGIEKGQLKNSYLLVDNKDRVDMVTQLDLANRKVGQPDITVYDYVKDYFKTNRWKRKIVPILTEEDFEYKVGLKFDQEISHFFTQDGSNKSAVLHNLVESYELYTNKDSGYTVRYSKKGDKLTLSVYNKDNKLVGKRIYHRLSNSKAKAVTKALSQERQEFKDRYE